MMDGVRLLNWCRVDVAVSLDLMGEGYNAKSDLLGKIEEPSSDDTGNGPKLD
jgi:hypothetical protein